MSPPSSGDASGIDDRPPTRRAVLATLVTTGCLGIGSVSDDPTPTPTASANGTPTATPTDAGVRATPTDEQDPVHLTVYNDTDEDREVRIRVGEDGDRFDEVRTVNAGVVSGVSTFPAEGTYVVAVEDRTGDRSATDRWAIRGALRDLRVVGEEIRFVQSATCDPTCPPVSVEGGEAVSLPYARDGAEETFSPANVEVTSRYGSTETGLRLVVRDGDATILDQEYRLAEDRRLRLPAVLETKGWYTVEAHVGDETATYDWHVAGNWPNCYVRIDARGVPRIGCGTDPRPLILVNERGEDATVDLRVFKRDETVWKGPVTLGADANLELNPVPLGDDLEVEARVGDATATGEYVTCYCRGGETTVTVSERVRVDRSVAVCEWGRVIPTNADA